jgi:hypothetical protein
MQKIGLKNRVLAALVNISAPRLSLYLKGCCGLKAGKDKELDNILNALVELQAAFPVTISLDDARELEWWLELLRRRKFEPFRKLTRKTKWNEEE